MAPAEHLTVAQARRRAVNRARRFMRIGLRSRITYAFALGAMTLSILLALVTYGLVRENLVNQREKAATNQAFFNASIDVAPPTDGLHWHWDGTYSFNPGD